MSSSFSHHSIQLSLAGGIIALVFAVLVPMLLSRHVRLERAREAACERQERIDCEPSVIWLLMK